MSDNTSGSNYIELTAEIVSAYVSNNQRLGKRAPGADQPGALGACREVSAGHGEAPSEPLKPADLGQAVDHARLRKGYLEDGKKFKSLKRHLRTQYNMTPEAYREGGTCRPTIRWSRPSYAAARSQLAKQMGLGQQRRRRGK